MLESLYESIRTEPFKIPQDDGNDLMHTFFNPDKEGLCKFINLLKQIFIIQRSLQNEIKCIYIYVIFYISLTIKLILLFVKVIYGNKAAAIRAGKDDGLS